MLESSFQYLNFDDSDDRQLLREKAWDRSKQQIIFDEIHKMKDWKRWLKGVYDKEGIPPQLTVTGSAKLDMYKKFGDSLAGRFFHYRIHPLDLKELAHNNTELNLDEALERLLIVSGFPEPFLRVKNHFTKNGKKLI